MLLSSLLLIPLGGIFIISSITSYGSTVKTIFLKKIALTTSLLNLVLSLILYTLFDFSSNQFQFVQEHYDLSFFDIYLGIDGISIYFVLLTTIIMPIALLSN
jgi:NADH-ubiquinone oxidoreductase chain 4